MSYQVTCQVPVLDLSSSGAVSSSSLVLFYMSCALWRRPDVADVLVSLFHNACCSLQLPLGFFGSLLA
eukprot:jgi/Botrbrau1/14717/Bobra.0108s0066.1